MLTAKQKKQIKAFHNNLSDIALSPDDPRYVAVFADEGDFAKEDPIREIAGNITIAESSSVNLLTGPRGSGKTTELKRLATLLRADDCVVFHCDMSRYMNLTTPVEVSDFLISVMAAFNDRVLGGNPLQTLPSIHVRQQDGSDDAKGLQLIAQSANGNG